MDIRAKQTFELLQVVVTAINKTLLVDSITQLSAGKYKIYTENTLWLTLGYTININGQDYVMVDLMPNEYIVVTGSVLPAATQFDIYAPFFDHGNVLTQNQKMNQVPSSTDKLPLIWLHEKVKEKFINDELNIIDRESDCNIYFLIDNNIEDWMQLEEDRYALKPMRNLVNSFIDACNDHEYILDDFNYDISDAPKFGSYVDSKGNVIQIFKDRVSGCEMKINLSFIQQINDC